MVELIDRFWQHVKNTYRDRNGSPSNHAEKFRLALKPLKMLYGKAAADAFGPLALKAVRDQFIQAGLARTSVNERVGYIKQMFAWGVENEIVSPSVHHALSALKGLRRGQTLARETEPIKPVSEQDVIAIRDHVSPQVWAIIQLQLLTAARPGEILIMQAIDLDTSERVWLYHPRDHKTAYRGHDRTVFIGPRGQEVIKAFLVGLPLDAPLFSPREAEFERHAKARTHRRPNQQPNSKKTNRSLGGRYTPGSYRRAIEYGCKTASVPVWTPHPLRLPSRPGHRRRYAGNPLRRRTHINTVATRQRTGTQ